MSANIDSIENIQKDKHTCFVDEARGMIALEATYEVESLARLMINIINQHYANDSDIDLDPIALRGLAMRIKSLNSVIMSAAGDNMENTKSLNWRFSNHSYEYMNEYSKSSPKTSH